MQEVHTFWEGAGMMRLDYSFILDGEWGGKSCFAEDYLLLAGIVAQLKPARVLEIGTSYGLGTAVLASWGASVYTIDIDQGNVRKNLHLLPGLWRKVTFDSRPSSEALRGLAGNGDRFQLVFIDGDHSYTQARRDFEMSLELSSVFVLHDTVQFAGMQQLVRDIARERSGMDVFRFVSKPGHRKYKEGALERWNFSTGMTLIQSRSNIERLPSMAFGDHNQKLFSHKKRRVA